MNINKNLINEQQEVTSDFEFVQNHMTKITNKTKISSDYCQENHTYTSSNEKNELYLKLNNVMNTYNEAQKMLDEKLQKEAAAITAIAGLYQQLDRVLMKDAGELK